MTLLNIKKTGWFLRCLILLFTLLLSNCAASKKTTPQLAHDLKSEDKEIRLAAAWTLGTRNDAAVPSLIEALNDTDNAVKYAAIWSLVNIGNPATKNALNGIIPFLTNDLQNEDPEIQKMALELLTAIKKPKELGVIKQ